MKTFSDDKQISPKCNPKVPIFSTKHHPSYNSKERRDKNYILHKHFLSRNESGNARNVDSVPASSSMSKYLPSIPSIKPLKNSYPNYHRIPLSYDILDYRTNSHEFYKRKTTEREENTNVITYLQILLNLVQLVGIAFNSALGRNSVYKYFFGSYYVKYYNKRHY